MASRRWTYLLLVVGAVLLLAAGLALAAPSVNFSLDWWTVDGGGGTLSGGTFELAGTAGQADAGLLSDGTYEFSGGFWTSVRYKVYMPTLLVN